MHREAAGVQRSRDPLLGTEVQLQPGRRNPQARAEDQKERSGDRRGRVLGKRAADRTGERKTAEGAAAGDEAEDPGVREQAEGLRVSDPQHGKWP